MTTIEKIIKTIKFCKEMGISYVEFDTDTEIRLTQGDSILLTEFYKDCKIVLKDKVKKENGKCIKLPKYQLTITINKEELNDPHNNNNTN